VVQVVRSDRVLATLSLPKLPRMLGGVIVRFSLE
jgi:hypothetical protein